MADSIHWFDTVDSTNTRLMNDKAELPDKTVYAARFQTAGRGQKGNRWESRPGENLTFSILLKPENISAAEQFILSEIVALGLVDYQASTPPSSGPTTSTPATGKSAAPSSSPSFPKETSLRPLPASA